MNLDQYKQVPKAWGREVWLVNHPTHCAKLLYIEAGQQCSLHYHPIKAETFFVLDGTVNLEVGLEGKPAYGTTNTQLTEGESFTLEPYTPHRFSSATDGPAIILEISSQHSDDDVVRLEESRAL